jgi:hypothetical protein
MAVVWNLCLGPGDWVARYQVIVSMIYATSCDGKYSRQAFYGAYIDWLSDRQRDHFLSKGLVRRVGADEAAGIDPAKPVLTGDDARHAIPADAPVVPVDLSEDDETPAAAELDSAVENVIQELKRLRFRPPPVPPQPGQPFVGPVYGSGIRLWHRRSRSASNWPTQGPSPMMTRFSRSRFSNGLKNARAAASRRPAARQRHRLPALRRCGWSCGGTTKEPAAAGFPNFHRSGRAAPGRLRPENW